MQIFKIAGLALTFVCFSLFGYFGAEKLNDRVKTLEKICAGIKRYQNLVSFSRREVAFILPESFEGTRIGFNGAAADIPRGIPLDGEERKMLETFFEAAGTQDVKGETERCRDYLGYFEQRRAAALETARQKRKIYLVSGVCCGVGAVVLFI